MTCETTAGWRCMAGILTWGITAALVDSLPSRAAEPLPNVLIVVADDLGYSDLGCYGSEIATPVLDSLAAAGTVFANFHAAPTCSPTRAMLLTGVDHHLAGMGNMYEFLRGTPRQIGKPGYEGYLNRSVLTIAEVLKTADYQTAIVGNQPRRDNVRAPRLRRFSMDPALRTHPSLKLPLVFCRRVPRASARPRPAGRLPAAPGRASRCAA